MSSNKLPIVDPDGSINVGVVTLLLEENRNALSEIKTKLDALDNRYALKDDIQDVQKMIDALNGRLARRVLGTGFITAVITSLVTALVTHIVEGMV